MDRLKEYTEMMNIFYDGSRIIHTYDMKPRNYGIDLNLYMAEMHTLEIIFDREGLTVTELAEISQKTKSAVTQLTNKLRKKGMITKLKNKEYHKEVLLCVTDLGRKACIYHKSLDEINYMNGLQHLKDFSIEDFRKSAEIFRIVTQSLKKDVLDNNGLLVSNESQKNA